MSGIDLTLGGGGEDALRFVTALMRAEGGVVELRALRVRRGSSHSTVSGYFDDPEKLIHAASQLDSAAEGIYVTLNRLNPGCLARSANRLQHRPQVTTGDGDVDSRQFLLIDVDPVRPSRVSATEEEKAAAFEVCSRVMGHLHSLGFPDPIVGDSGNGFHLLYRVQLDADDRGLTKRLLSVLAKEFNSERAKVDESVHNPGRIVKLYGTLACKGDPIDGRPHRRSSIISMPAVLDVVPEDLIRAAADTDVPTVTNAAGPQSPSAGSTFDVEGFIVRHGLDVGREGEWHGGYRWELRVCPFSAEHTDSSAFIVRHASGAVAAGCHHNGCRGKGWRDLRRLLDGETVAARERSGPPPSKPAKARQAREPREPFPLELLPTAVQRYVVALSDSRSVAVGVPAALALAAMASAIGLSRSVWDEYSSWEEFPILWIAVVSPSGTRKTILVRDLFFPHEKRQAQLFAEFQARQDSYRRELDDWEFRRKNTKSLEPEPRPEHPVLQHVYTSDTTPEALVDILQSCERGALVLCDELAAFFGGLGRYSGMKDADRSFYLSLFRGMQIKKDRKSGPPTFVECAAAWIVGGVQPSILRTCFDDAAFGSGLASRFLLVAPSSQVKQYRAGPSEGDKAEFEKLINALFALEREPYSDAEGRIRHRTLRVPLSSEARDLLREFVPEWSAKSLVAAEDMEAAMSKLEGYALRFALILRVCRELEGRAEESDPISREDLEGGIRLSTWFRAEAFDVYADLRADEQATAHDKLLSRVTVIRERFGGAVTAREWRQLNTRRTSAEARQELQELVDARLADWRARPSSPKGGKPTEECRVRDDRGTPSAPEDAIPGCGLRDPNEGSSGRHPEPDPQDGSADTSIEDPTDEGPPLASVSHATRNPQLDTDESGDPFTESVSERFSATLEPSSTESAPVSTPPRERSCAACGGLVRWRLLPSGPWTCSVCHPPQAGERSIETNQDGPELDDRKEVRHG